MKKTLLFLFAVILSVALKAQVVSDCGDLIISEYVEGWNNNKALELYNPTNATITLDNNYRLIRYSNGSSTSDQDPLYNLPLVGSIAPYSVMVMIQDTNKAGQDTMVWPELRKKATWLAPYDYNGTTPGGNVVFWNGDDAVSLQKLINNQWKDIDIFGEIGVRPTNWQGTYNPTGSWTDTKPYITGVGRYLTKSKTLVRKHTVKKGIDRIAMLQYGTTSTNGIPDSFYALAEYDTLPANTFDSLGFHTCDCKSAQGVDELKQNDFSVYPNPVSGSVVEIKSNTSITYVEVINALGQVIYQQPVSNRKAVNVTIGELNSGIYFVRVRFAGNSSISKKIYVI